MANSLSQVPEPKPVPILTAAFATLIGGHFLQALGYASLLLLPLYLDHLGASRGSIGAFMALGSLGGLAIRPLVGWALDNVGRRPTLMVGTLLLASGLFCIGLVQSLGPLLFVSRLLTGTGVAALFTGYFTFAADLVPESRRAEGIALFGISGLVPIVIGPLFGLTGLPAGSLSTFLPVVGLVVASSFGFLIAISEPETPASQEKPTLKGALQALGAPPLLPVWMATLLFSGLVAVFMTFATVVAQRRGVSMPALLWFGYAGAAVLVRSVGAKLPERIGPRNVVVPAIGSYLLAFLIAASAQSNLAFLVAGTLGGIAHGYGFPVLLTQAVNRTPRQLRGSSLALYTALWDLSSLILTPLLGTLSDQTDDATMFSAAACGGIALLALWVILEQSLSSQAAPKLRKAEDQLTNSS